MGLRRRGCGSWSAKYIDLSTINQYESDKSVDKKLTLRTMTCKLAHTMYWRETEENMAITSGVQQWKVLRNDTKINETFSHARFSVNYCSL